MATFQVTVQVVLYVSQRSVLQTSQGTHLLPYQGTHSLRTYLTYRRTHLQLTPWGIMHTYHGPRYSVPTFYLLAHAKAYESRKGTLRHAVTYPWVGCGGAQVANLPQQLLDHGCIRHHTILAFSYCTVLSKRAPCSADRCRCLNRIIFLDRIIIIGKVSMQAGQVFKRGGNPTISNLYPHRCSPSEASGALGARMPNQSKPSKNRSDLSSGRQEGTPIFPSYSLPYLRTYCFEVLYWYLCLVPCVSCMCRCQHWHLRRHYKAVQHTWTTPHRMHNLGVRAFGTRTWDRTEQVGPETSSQGEPSFLAF